jgi:transketolase
MNRLQISGWTKDVMPNDNLADKLRDFGWKTIEVSDGNSTSALAEAYKEAESFKGQPTAVIAHTVKGKGVSFMENEAKWHHGVMNEEQYRKAEEELIEAAI